jgi:hypothetical protein
MDIGLGVEYVYVSDIDSVEFIVSDKGLGVVYV